tara:strand:- start:705 stop:1097 length:393 start_codon:yes stop_codon:yes gene_type:complete
MTKILMGIIAAMGITGLLYYNLSVVPMKVKLEEQVKIIAAQELRDQEQKATIEAIQNNLQKTSKELTGLQVRNQAYEQEMAEYMDIFRRHNLSKLASAKPGMIETRVNNKTKEAFDAIEEDSKRISSLND